MITNNTNWKRLKQNRTELIILSYTISCLLTGLIFIEYYFTNSYLIHPPFMIVLSLGTYYLIKHFEGFYLPDKPTFRYYFFVISYISIITFIIIFNSNLNRHFLKIFYFIPLILSSITFGYKMGLFASIYASANICFLNYFINDYSHLDYDIIIVILFFWISWILGRLINIERKVQQHLNKLAITDSLTGLPNFGYFKDQLNLWFEKAKNSNDNLSLAMADLDNFKNYNDALGHQQGDDLLEKIASLLQTQTNDNIFISRYGGDEFAILLYNHDKDLAEDKILQIKSYLNNELIMHYDNFLRYKPTFSFGIASYPEQTNSKKDLVDKADQALYQAKATQKNNIKVYYDVLNELTATQEININLHNSLRTFLSIINSKDKYTYGHTERVVNYTEIFIDNLDIAHNTKNKILYGAFLHDIGKIEIDSEILNKPGKLNSSEWIKIKRHPRIGAQILQPVDQYQEISPMVIYHHEDFDGTGYPEGLKGKNIPFNARILRIIDSFDAMTTERPYSKAMKKNEALIELQQQAGKQFDPDLVDKFIQISDRIPL